MNKQMKKYNIILITGLIFFSFLLAFTSPTLATPQDANYTFNGESLIDENNPSTRNSFNVRNQQIDGNPTGLQEPDKFEFDYETAGEVHTNNLANYNGWDVVETGHASAGVLPNEFQYNPVNRGLMFWLNDGESGVAGLEKTFTITSELIETGFSIDPIDVTPPDVPAGGEFFFHVYSSDDTKIVSIKVEFHTDIVFGYEIFAYYSGGWNSLHNYINVAPAGFRPLLTKLLIDYSDDTCTVNLMADEDGWDEYETPLITNSKEGLSLIEANIISGDTSINLDYIYVYDNTESLSNDYCFYTININSTGTWEYNTHNIVILDLDNTCSIAGGRGIYTGGTAYPFADNITFNGQTIMNLYNIFNPSGFINPDLIFFFNTNHTFNNVSYVYVGGVTINEGTNKYWLQYDYDNVNIFESYFYVDSNNYLQFYLAMNDTEEEFIQATFLITQETENYIFYIRQKTSLGNSYCYTRLDYTDDSTTTFVMPTTLIRVGRQFTQTRTIDALIIHISDNDKYENGNIYGYITEINFIYLYSGISIVSTTFIAIIPVLFILIPLPIFMFNKYDKNPIVLIGTFFVMALVCVITTLIPIWLMFIFILGMGLVMSKKRGE